MKVIGAQTLNFRPKFKFLQLNFIRGTLKIQRIGHYNFGASVSISTKHFPYDVPRDRRDNMCITFGRSAP